MRGPNWTASAILIASVLLVSGCDGIAGDGYDVQIQTDATNYLTTTSTTIELSVKNRSDDVVYYLCGGEFFIERFYDGDFDETIGALPNCACLCPKPIEPGDSREQGIPLSDGVIEWIYAPYDVEGDFDFDPSKVTYRVRFYLYEDTEFEDRLDPDNERSNEFKLDFPTR